MGKLSKIITIIGFLMIFALKKSVQAMIFRNSYGNVAFKTAEEIILLRKFNFETHNIITVDGYFLNAIRIKNPLIKTPVKGPVLFISGILTSVNLYLANSRNVKPRKYLSNCPLESDEIWPTDYRSAPLLLSNVGYDVWLVDNRGVGKSIYALGANFTNANFWNFNLDTLAMRDLPAAVKYIKKVTNKSTIGFVGYSQGSFQMLAALTQFDYLNKSLKPSISLAPIAYFENSTGLAVELVTLIGTMYEASILKGAFPSYDSSPFRHLIVDFCRLRFKLCQKFAQQLTGKSSTTYSLSFISFFGYSTSVQVVSQFLQLKLRKKFSTYDFGENDNKRLYGQSKPPLYNVSRITNKYLAFIRGTTDVLSTLSDSQRLIDNLKVPHYRDVVINGSFNHIDMMIGEYSDLLVNKPVLEILESANGCKKFHS